METASFTTSNNWARGTVNGEGSASISMRSTPLRKDWLMTPSIQLTSTDNKILEFDVLLSALSSGQRVAETGPDDKFIVLISLDNGETWSAENAVVWSSDALADYALSDLTNVYKTYQIPLSGITGTIKIAFYGESSSNSKGAYLHIDNVAVTDCGKPLNVRLIDIDNQSITLEWVHATENEFVVEYKKASDIAWTAEAAIGVNHTISGLEANSDYHIRVRTECASAVESHYSPVLYAKTECATITLPLFEGFEGLSVGSNTNLNAPPCWSYVAQQASAATYVSSTSPNSGGRCYYMNNASSSANMKTALVSPRLPENISNLRIRFYAKGAAATRTLHVGYLTNPLDITTFVNQETLTLTTSWAEYEVSFGNVSDVSNTIVYMHGQSANSQAIYLDDIFIEKIPACADIDVSVIEVIPAPYSASVILSNIPAGTTGIEVRYRHVDSVEWIYQFGTSLNPYISDLTPKTAYEYSLRTLCGQGGGAWTYPKRFETPCDITFPYFENFDNSPGSASSTTPPNAPECWKYIRTYSSGRAFVYSGEFSSSPNSYRLYNGMSTNTSYKMALVSPVLPEELSTLRVAFKAKSTRDDAVLKVGYLRDYADENTFVEYEKVVLTTNYEEYVVNFDTLTASADNIVLMHGMSTSGQYIYLDDIVIEEIPTCPEGSVSIHPNTLKIQNITTVSADVHCEATGDIQGFDIKYRAKGTSQWQEDYISAMPYTMSGLTHSTEYEYIIRPLCSGGAASWIPVHSFLTAIELPYQQYFDGVVSDVEWPVYKNNDNPGWVAYTTLQYVSSPKSVQLSNASSGPQDHLYFVSPKIDPNIDLSTVQIRFKAKSSIPGLTLSVGMINSDSPNSFELLESVTLTDTWNNCIVTLANYSGPNYRFAFKHDGHIASTSIYIDNIDIEYIPACQQVANLSVVYNMGESLELRWGDISGEPYIIEYHIKDSSTIYRDASYDPHYTLTGLTEFTEYVIKVKADCMPETWSDSIVVRTGQTPAILPFHEDFEQPSSWMLTNGSQINHWIIGTDMTANDNGGDYCLYITNDPATGVYNYSHNTSHVYASKNILITEAGDYVMYYHWKNEGETGSRDCLKAYVAPLELANYSAGSLPSTAYWSNVYQTDGSGTGLFGRSEWQQREIAFNISKPGVYQVIFYWYNDNRDGTPPPAAVDNISVYKLTCQTPRDITLSALSSTSATISYTMPLVTPEKFRLFYKEASADSWTDSTDVVISGMPTDTLCILPTFSEYGICLCHYGNLRRKQPKCSFFFAFF